MVASPDGQKARSLATQVALMEAAEKLIARNGLHNISIKEIVREAGQKNESSMQYHFKNLEGLIRAIHARRNAQTFEKRAELLADLESATEKPSVRDLCRIMVMPTYLLAKEDSKFRRYIAAFSHEIGLTEESALVKVSKSGGGGESGQRTGELLRTALAHLDEPAYRQRMDLAVRWSAVAMGHHAKQKNSFRGPESDLFISRLVDALEGVLNAPVSEETQVLAQSSRG